MAEEPKKPPQDWLAAEDEVWAGLQKRQRRRRDLFWVLVALVLFVLGSVTGFPGRFFT